MNSVFVSYIIAVYNVKIPLLERCITSVISHMGEDDEALIINDGSTDPNIEKLCKTFAGKNVFYFYQQNQGISAVRNFGIKTAKGRYIAFIDGDDYLTAGLAPVSEEIMEKDIYFLNYGLCSNGQFLLKKPCLPDNIQEVSPVQVIKSVLDYNTFGDYFIGVIWNKLFARDFLLRNKLFFDENIRKDEDGLFVLKCMLADPSIKYMNFQCYVYYINQNSVCHKFNPLINDLYIDALKEWGEIVNQIRETKLLEEETLNNGFNRQIFSAIQGALHINAFNQNIKMNYLKRRKLALETYRAFDENFNLKKLKISKFYSKKNHIKFNLIKHKHFLFVWLYVKITGKGL